MREVGYLPKAGIGQGDPFSLVLFSFCVSLVLHLLTTVRNMISFMYAYDLYCIIAGVHLVRTLARVQHAMNVFAKFSGPVLSLIKREVVIKGKLNPKEHNPTPAGHPGSGGRNVTLCSL